MYDLFFALPFSAKSSENPTYGVIRSVEEYAHNISDVPHFAVGFHMSGMSLLFIEAIVGPRHLVIPDLIVWRGAGQLPANLDGARS